MRLPLRLLVLAAALGAAACSDGSGPASGASGVVRFAYAGTASGTFRAEGDLAGASGLGVLATGAAGVVQDSTLAVLSFSEHAPPRGALFVLGVEGIKGKGTYPIDPVGCAGDPLAGGCTTGVFFPDVDLFELADSARAVAALSQAWVMIGGTITVTSVTSARARGTFTGSAIRASATGAITGTIAITDGSFDVPLQEP